MAITYQKTPLEWKNEGAEPSNALKTGGFEPGMKPTADAFNYFWHNAGEVEKELQSKLSAEATARETADTTLQNNINKKQATITGAATTVTSSNLTTNRALISNSSGKIAVSAITDTELGYLDGTTSNVQTQLNNVNKSISSEATARETADNTLQGKINTEETARKAKDNALQNQLNEKTGYDMSGQAVYTLGADIVAVAGTNAELLNDYRTRTFGEESFFDGGTVPTSGNVASGSYSTAAGQCTTAIGGNSFAIGNETVASGLNSFASGGRTHALGEASHAEGGGGSSAEGLCSHAEGGSTQALEDYSHSEGYATVAHRYQHAQGRCNKVSHGAASATDMTGDLFIVGNGTLENRGNALRTATEGRTYGLASFLASGADYAEMWEYADGNPKNEDRRGYFVTVDENNKIHIANAEDDYILGVISACPVVVGDIQSEMWKDMYLTDIYGNKLTETVEVPETIDEKTGTIIPAHTETRWILNPDYDPEQEYICREDRPEWDAVGLLGKLIVNDDGTAKVGGFCKVANGGIATNSEDKSGWRVLERLDDKHIKILYR